MLIHADDFGVLALDHLELKAKILPYENGDADIIGQLLDSEILPRGLAQVFTIPLDRAEPRRYLFITNFLKHQRIDRPGHPELPGWVKVDTPATYLQRILANRQSSLDFAGNSTNVRRMLDEYSTNVRGGREGKGVEGRGSEGRGAEPEAVEIRSSENQNPPLENQPSSMTADPSPITIDAEELPLGDLSAEQLAKGMMDKLSFSGGPSDLRIWSDAIKFKARDAPMPLGEAYSRILTSALTAKKRGEFEKPTFWMKDGCYDHKPKRSKNDVFETGRNAAERLTQWNAAARTARA
jgi:hypothetical protein